MFNSKLLQVQYSYTMITTTVLVHYSVALSRQQTRITAPFDAWTFPTFRCERIAPATVGRSENYSRTLFLQNTFRTYRLRVNVRPVVVPLKHEKINVLRTRTCVYRAATSGRAKSILLARGWPEIVCTGRFPRRCLRLLCAYVPITGYREKITYSPPCAFLMTTP